MYISTPVPKEEIIFVRKELSERILFIKVICIDLYCQYCVSDTLKT